MLLEFLNAVRKKSNLLWGKINSQVSARNYYTICFFQDLVKMLQSLNNMGKENAKIIEGLKK